MHFLSLFSLYSGNTAAVARMVGKTPAVFPFDDLKLACNVNQLDLIIISRQRNFVNLQYSAHRRPAYRIHTRQNQSGNHHK